MEKTFRLNVIANENSMKHSQELGCKIESQDDEYNTPT